MVEAVAQVPEAVALTDEEKAAAEAEMARVDALFEPIYAENKAFEDSMTEEEKSI